MSLGHALGIPFRRGGGVFEFDPAEAPTLLTATTISDVRIDLAWTSNSGGDEEGFSIERGTDGVNFAWLNTVLTGVVTYNDSSCVADTLYYYRVRAFRGAAWSLYSNIDSATTYAIPEAEDALFCLTEITGDNFVDIINGWLFPITNKDWEDDEGYWTGDTTIFPFKSAATLSPPADAGIKAQIIACDPDNFWYDGGGTPNAIPIQAFFQNINFSNRYFCAYVDHTVNGDLEELTPAGVKYITLYTSARTITAEYTTFFGADVTLPVANAMFVSKAGNDGTGDGSFATPYLTIDKGIINLPTGNTLWVLSGTYNEASAGYDYLRLNRANTTLNIKSAGNVQLQSASATYALYVVANTQIVNFYGFVFQPKYIYLNKQATIYTRCRFSGAGMNNAGSATISNSVITGTFLCNGTPIFIGNMSLNAQVTPNFVGDGTITYNKFKTTTGNNNYGLAYGGSFKNSIIRYNYFELNGTGYGINVGATTVKLATHLATIERNIFKSKGTGLRLFPSDVTASSTFKAIVQYNKFIDLSINYTITAFGINTESSIFEESDFQYNYFYSENIGITRCFLINPTNINAPFNINYNRFFMDTKTGIHLSFGEGSTGGMDGTQIISNLFNGYLRTTAYDAGATTHGLLVNGGNNFTVKFNRFENMALGLAFKANGGEQYTAGGIFYNVFYNNSAHYYIRRAGSLNVFGNTMYNSMAASSLSRVGAIDDQGYAGSCRGDVFTNNIFCHNKTGANQIYFYVESTGIDGVDDILWDDNIFYADASVYAISDEIPNLYTYAQAVTNGWITNGEQATPVFNNGATGQLWLQAGSPGRGDGTDLGATYDDGLDISTDWNNDPDDDDPDNYPTIVTKEQGVNWDKGAYVH